MHARPLLITLAVAAATVTAASCGTTPHPADATPIRNTPTPAQPEPQPSPTDPSTPPTTEMSAVSLDTQAKLTAEGALILLLRCERHTADLRRCTTDDAQSSLPSHPSVPWGAGLAQVRITAGSPTTFTLDSRSHSGAHFMIRRQRAGAERRTCSGSVSECTDGHWDAIAGVAASLRPAP